MKSKIFSTILTLFGFILTINAEYAPVTVTLTIDEGVERPAAIANAEKNLGIVLTEINRAQEAKSILTTKHLPMDDFSLKSLIRLWAVTPFYCDDEEVVERCWVFKDGSMMVSHIPLIITPEGEDFGLGTYQEAVVEFDRNGKITDFRLALDAHTAESMEKCGTVVEKEKQMIIMHELVFELLYQTLKQIQVFYKARVNRGIYPLREKSVQYKLRHTQPLQATEI